MISPPLKKKIDVLAYLHQEGWQVSKTALYDACKDGLLRPDKRSAMFEARAIERYAKKHLRRQETGQRLDDEREARAKRKDEAETRKLEAQADKAEREFAVLEGKYIPRADLELELAGRAVVLDAGIRTLIQAQAPAWIELTGGDQAKTPDLIETVLNSFGGLMNEYATTDRFQVVFKATEE